ncbi:hypothetical protein OF83DRAFT_1118314, partial [Amylostereum chailletii]
NGSSTLLKEFFTPGVHSASCERERQTVRRHPSRSQPSLIVQCLTWTGSQLVVSGDFFQLPPVTDTRANPSFTFDAKTWKGCI